MWIDASVVAVGVPAFSQCRYGSMRTMITFPVRFVLVLRGIPLELSEIILKIRAKKI